MEDNGYYNNVIFDGGEIRENLSRSVTKITNQFSTYKAGFMKFGSNEYNSFISSMIIVVLILVLVYKGNDDSWLTSVMNDKINLFSTSFISLVTILMFSHIYFWTTEYIADGGMDNSKKIMRSFSTAREIGFYFVGLALMLTIMSLPITIDTKEVYVMYIFIGISMALLLAAYLLIRSTRTLYYITSLLIINIIFLLTFIKF